MPFNVVKTPPRLAIKSPPDEVVSKVNELGLSVAARKFGTSPSSLSRWLRAQGYKSKFQYVKEVRSLTTA